LAALLLASDSGGNAWFIINQEKRTAPFTVAAINHDMRWVSAYGV
jgi:hypothetical protein